MRTTYALADEISIAQDAAAIGRKPEALNLLLEHHTLAEALYLLTPDRTPLVGDVLVASWGYGQTNIDYYQVVGVTTKSVKIVPITSQISSRDEYNDYLVPNASRAVDQVELQDRPFKGKPATRRFECTRDSSYGHSYRVNWTSYCSLRLWDGQPHRQTGANYGH